MQDRQRLGAENDEDTVRKSSGRRQLFEQGTHRVLLAWNVVEAVNDDDGLFVTLTPAPARLVELIEQDRPLAAQVVGIAPPMQATLLKGERDVVEEAIGLSPATQGIRRVGHEGVVAGDAAWQAQARKQR